MDAQATWEEFARLRRRLTELRHALGAHRARLRATPASAHQALGLVAEGRRLHAELRRVRRRFAALPPPGSEWDRGRPAAGPGRREGVD